MQSMQSIYGVAKDGQYPQVTGLTKPNTSEAQKVLASGAVLWLVCFLRHSHRATSEKLFVTCGLKGSMVRPQVATWRECEKLPALWNKKVEGRSVKRFMDLSWEEGPMSGGSSFDHKAPRHPSRTGGGAAFVLVRSASNTSLHPRVLRCC